MPDITIIPTLLASIKHATDITKVFKDADYSFEKAETKLKMAELISALADVKVQAAGVQELVLEKDKRIAELESWKAETQRYKLIEIAKGVFVYVLKLEYIHDEPIHWLCPNCFENKRKSILQRADKTPSGTSHNCSNCKNVILDHSDQKTLEPQGRLIRG